MTSVSRRSLGGSSSGSDHNMLPSLRWFGAGRLSTGTQLPRLPLDASKRVQGSVRVMGLWFLLERCVMFAAAWTASPQLPSEGFTPNWSREGFWRQSLRQVVRLTAGGERVRVRFSNAYGNSPVRIASGSVARGGAAVRLTFGGAVEGEMPARGELVSDGVQLAVAAGSRWLSRCTSTPPPDRPPFMRRRSRPVVGGRGVCWVGRGSPSRVSPGTSCPPSRPTPGGGTGSFSLATPSPMGSDLRLEPIGGGPTRWPRGRGGPC